MNRLEVYPGLRVSRGKIFSSCGNSAAEKASVTKEGAGDTIFDRIGFFMFVSSAVALLMIVSFYFKVSSPETPVIDITLQSISNKLSKVSYDEQFVTKVSQTFSYMLPANFESRKLDQIKNKEFDNQVSQTRFITSLIKTNSKILEASSLAKTIVTQSKQLGYDPLFVTAVILAESRFDKKAISHAGALGLMQILPSTAKYITTKISPSQWKGHSYLLVDEAYNINLGITYLKYLDGKFKGNKRHTLVAYNWGPGNMNRALKGQSQIPSVSQKYRDSILSTYAKWSSQFKRRDSELAGDFKRAKLG